MKGDIEMNQKFIEASMRHFIYELKEGTNSSYYSQTSSILPNRLSISDFDMSKVENKGRVLSEGKKGQILSKFKLSEESPLKQFKPYVCRTEIFKCIDFPLLFGYGTIGISDENGKVSRQSDTGDMVVLYSADNQQTFHIFFFYGLGRPEYKNEVLSYVNEWVKKI